MHQPVVALEHRRHLGREGRVGVQARHFVLVLVGHQLEQVARHRLGQAGAAQRRLGGAHAVDEGAVLRRVGRVLVAGEELHPPRHHLVERGLAHELDHLRRLEQRLHRREVVRAAPAPFERRLVVVHLHAVEFHRSHQRRVGQRDAALLPGVAQQQRVGVDRVSHQLQRGLLGVERAHQGVADAALDRRFALRRRELPVGVAHEGGRGGGMRVQRHEGAPGLHR